MNHNFIKAYLRQIYELEQQTFNFDCDFSSSFIYNLEFATGYFLVFYLSTQVLHCEGTLHYITSGSCGSCWTFGAVSALEANYYILTGEKKTFAEQEYLDCAYSK